MEIIDWFEDEDAYNIAMEYHPLGDLDNFFSEPLPESYTKTIIWQILRGLRYLHYKDITHRDIKPSNILVVEAPSEAAGTKELRVKIADFGISKRAGPSYQGTRQKSQLGTPGYTAPEIALGDGMATYSNACDIWSLGCLQLWLLARISKDHRELNRSGIIDQLRAEFGTSEDGIEFLSSLLAYYAEDRPTAVRALESPWLKDVGLIPGIPNSELVNCSSPSFRLDPTSQASPPDAPLVNFLSSIQCWSIHFPDLRTC